MTTLAHHTKKEIKALEWVKNEILPGIFASRSLLAESSLQPETAVEHFDRIMLKELATMAADLPTNQNKRRWAHETANYMYRSLDTLLSLYGRK